MASNAPGQSVRPAYHPPLSLEDGASNFTIGECVLVRIPEPIQIEGYVDNEATVVGTDLPLTSNGSSPQHFAFIRAVALLPDGSYVLEVYPVLSFPSGGGAVPAYNGLSDAAKAALLPLPPLSLRHPTPEAFGAPLDFGNWSTSRDSFLHVVPKGFIMPTRRPFKRVNPPLIMPPSALFRIERYREYLRLHAQTTNPHNHDDQLEKEAGAGLEQFFVKLPHGLLVLEGVDEDAEDADATMRDELIMLAHDDPIWREELRRYLQEEEKERKRIQKERAARLACWREDMTVHQPENC